MFFLDAVIKQVLDSPQLARGVARLLRDPVVLGELVKACRSTTVAKIIDDLAPTAAAAAEVKNVLALDLGLFFHEYMYICHHFFMESS